MKSVFLMKLMTNSMWMLLMTRAKPTDGSLLLLLLLSWPRGFCIRGGRLPVLAALAVLAAVLVSCDVLAAL